MPLPKEFFEDADGNPLPIHVVELPPELLNAPVVFGLVAQGHIPTIQSMLEQGKSWTEIGEVIGWEPKTAREHYERHCHRPGTWEHDVLPVLAAAVGMLEKLAKNSPVWDRNDIASIVLQANKQLHSTPHGPYKYEY